MKDSSPEDQETATEAVPAEQKTETGVSAYYGALKTIGLCSLYIALSGSLIRFNKHLMHKEVFPFAIALTTYHMSVTCVLCYALYFIKPNLYPAMANVQDQRMTIVKYFIPLGLLFALGLVCSNHAYLYCSVTFLQFLKEGNVILVFGLAVLVGTAQCTRSKLFVLAWILVGAGMAVHGEVHFVMFGLAIQLCSQLCECGRAILGEKVMTDGMKLDALTYTMFMAPVCLVLLSVACFLTWEHEIFLRFKEFWPILIPNGCLAFLLNVSVAVLIKECSAITFMLTGLVKDMLLVLACVFFFDETVAPQQFVGFAVCLAGIGFWSLMKIDPESAAVKGLKESLGETENSELQQLLKKKALAL